MTGFSASLPDCRAYEMVTPPYKEGFEVSAGSSMSADGSDLLGESRGNLLDPEGRIPQGSGVDGHFYDFVRGASGWQTLPIDAPYSRFESISEVTSQSQDLARRILILDETGHRNSDVYLDEGGALTFVGPTSPAATVTSAFYPAGASDDLHRLLFDVHGQPAEYWPGDTTATFESSLYEYSGTGNTEPSLVGVSNQFHPSHGSEAHLISDCGTYLGAAHETDAYNAVSADGELTYFTSIACAGGPPVNELFARLNGERTLAISEPPLNVAGRTCTGTCELAEIVPSNRRPATFAGASSDGSKVLFTTSQPLLDSDTDTTADLYEAELQGGSVVRIAQISAGGTGDSTPGANANVLGVSRVSEDGSHVYFVAMGALTGANREGRLPVVGQPNLYVNAETCAGAESSCATPVEHTSFIATLAGSDGADWSEVDTRPVQATADGRFLVFQSKADLIADQGGRQEAGQVFEYDAETETLVRVSRGQGGFNEDGNSPVYPANIPSQSFTVTEPDKRIAGLTVSADGSRVFFQTADALTPQALPGFSGVYEYHSGTVSLIAGGRDATAPEATGLVGTDESGRDVFFTTTDRLLPQDRDLEPDVYDARVEGGFTPVAEPQPCSGDTCQGPAAPVPSLPTPSLATPEPPPALPPPSSTPAVRTPTSAQRLASALNACRRKPKRTRARCEKQAKQRYRRSK
ncbi:MAG TPA: hypothetical protein VGH60_07025 [Solirubrobacteraceae bacterium]|jgi:hypothetical protein